MHPATGADLPPEIIAKILSNFMNAVILATQGNYKGRKHELVAPSLVCKYWAECIRPALFRDIILRNASDVSFLKNIVFSPRFNDSSLHRAIKFIRAKYIFPPQAEPWLHHLHPIVKCLPETQVWCAIWGDTGDSQLSIPIRWPPFAALPRIPPSFYSSLRLSTIQITDCDIKSTTELARLVDSFSTLEDCYFFQLRFLDPSPIIQARRIPRNVPKAFRRCKIAECADMSISAQATLALDLMAAVPRVGLAARDRQWSTLLDTLLTPVPNFLQQAVVNLPESEDGCLDGYASDKIVIGFAPDKDAPDNYILANMWVKRTHTSGTRAEDAPAYVSEVTLTASVAIAGDTGPTSFDGFRGAAGFAPIERLRFYVREGNALDEQGMQSLLRSLLRREQLTWALERGILRLQRSVLDEEANTWDEAAYFDSSSILRALGNHLLITIDDTTPTLDDDEYAEYLSLFFEEDMDDYLRRLPALRSERAMAKARSALEEMPGSPGVQDAAAMTQRTNAAEGEGDEPSRETEGRA